MSTSFLMSGGRDSMKDRLTSCSFLISEWLRDTDWSGGGRLGWAGADGLVGAGRRGGLAANRGDAFSATGNHAPHFPECRMPAQCREQFQVMDALEHHAVRRQCRAELAVTPEPAAPLVALGDGDAGDDQKLAEHCAVDQGPLPANNADRL